MVGPAQVELLAARLLLLRVVSRPAERLDGRGDGQGDGELAADDPSAESANDNRRRMAIDRPGVDLKV